MNKKKLAVIIIDILAIIVMIIIGLARVQSKSNDAQYGFDIAMQTQSKNIKSNQTIAIDLSVKDISMGEYGLNAIIANLEYDKSIFKDLKIKGLSDKSEWNVKQAQKHETIYFYSMIEGTNSNQRFARVELELKDNVEPQLTQIKLSNIRSSTGNDIVKISDKVLNLRVNGYNNAHLDFAKYDLITTIMIVAVFVLVIINIWAFIEKKLIKIILTIIAIIIFILLFLVFDEGRRNGNKIDVVPVQEKISIDYSDKNLLKVKYGTTITNLKNEFLNQGKNINVYDENNNIITDGILKPGMIVRVVEDDSESYICIAGDYNNDGEFDVSDITNIIRDIIKVDELKVDGTNNNIDVDSDGDIDEEDVKKLLDIIPNEIVEDTFNEELNEDDNKPDEYNTDDNNKINENNNENKPNEDNNNDENKPNEDNNNNENKPNEDNNNDENKPNEDNNNNENKPNEDNNNDENKPNEDNNNDENKPNEDNNNDENKPNEDNNNDENKPNEDNNNDDNKPNDENQNTEETIKVAYKIEHYTENLDGTYELKELENLTGEVNEKVIAKSKNYIGFTENTQHLERITEGLVNSDGSLVLKLYYTRNEYDLTVTAGEYITNVSGTGKYKYGQEVEIKADLENNLGYTYKNFRWETTGDISDKTSLITTIKIPSENLEVKAIQERDTVKYNLKFNLDNGQTETENKNEFTVEDEEFTVINPTRKGYTFIGWTGTDITTPIQTLIITNGATGDREYTANWSINEYTITYNLNDGTIEGTNPEKYTVETEDIIVINPIKQGYTFIGWTGTELENPTKDLIIQRGSIENREYTANWEANKDTKYKVEHYIEELDGNYTLKETDNLEGETEGVVTAVAKDYTGFTENQTNENRLAEGIIKPDGSLVLKLYYSRNEYDLTVTAGEYITNVIGTGKYKYGQEVEITAEKESLPGYTYTNFRWETIDTAILTNTTEITTKVKIPANNIEVIASQERTINEYTISYNLNDGTIEGTNPEKYTVETENITLINPTKTGYTFTGWTGTDLVELTQTVVIPKGSIENREYTANWETNKDTDYKVEHYIEELNGTYTLKETDNLKGETDITVTGPLKDYTGFTVNQTHKDSIAEGTIKPDGSLVLKLYYSRNEYDLTVTAGDNITNTTGTGKYKYEQEIEITAVKEDLPGYTYTNFRWETIDTTILTNTTEVTIKVKIPATNVEVIAKQDRTVNEYTISYNLNDGTVEGTNPEKYTVETENITLINPTKVGYTFIGWTGTDIQTPLETVVIEKGTIGNKEYIANWKENGDTPYKVEHYKEQLDGNYIIENETYIQNLTAATDSEVIATALSLEGYTENATHKDRVEKGNVKPDGSLVLRLYYSRNEYDLTVIAGENIANVTGTGKYKYGQEVEITAEKENLPGYTYTNFRWETIDTAILTNTTEITTKVTIPASNVEVIAKQERVANEYIISYNLNDGILEGTNPEKYTVESENIILINPSKQGYTFIGWTGTELTEKTNIVVIPKGSVGNREYTANWEPNKDTAFKTEYYLEELDGTYKLNDTDYSQGETGASAIADPYIYPGFTENTTHPDRIDNGIIKPDGSLVLRLYYSRNEYDLTVTAGNYITSVTGSGKYKYEQEVEITAEKENLPGYTYINFKWDKTEIASIENIRETTTKVKIPANNIEVIASQERIINEYTISYNLNAGTVEGTNPEKYTVETEDITLKNPTRTGYTFTGWTGTDLAELTQTVTIPRGSIGNKEYTANWETNKDTDYKVEHYIEELDGTYTLKETDNLEGETETQVTAIAKDYTGFTEKQTHEDRVSEGTIKPDGSLVLKLYYSRNEYDLTVTAGDYITAVTGSGKYKYEQEVEITAEKESLPGYTYTNFRWEALEATIIENTTETTKVTIPAKSIEVIANQERVAKEYTISYNLDGGTIEGTNPEKYTIETENITLINPSKPGYKFTGWTGTDLTEKTNTVVIEKGSIGNKEYTANWEPNKLTINYYSNNATESFDNALNQVAEGENVLVFTFDVAYDAGARENGLHDYTTEESSLYLARTGYIATGNWGTEPAGGIIVNQSTAWENTESFANLVGKSLLTEDAIIDLYPIWESDKDTKYKVEHYIEELDGTYTLKETDNLSGETETTATAVAKGYTGFTENLVHTDRKSSGTIYADGSLILKLYYSRNEYDLTVTAGDYITSVTGSGKYKYEQEVEITAEKENLPGYTYTNFRWETLDATIFENASETTTKVTVPAANTEIIASQERTINEYTISYNLNDGTVEGINPEKYTVETEDITLINPTKQGYTFTGWTGTDLSDLTQTVVIPKGTTGNKEYIANWETNKDTAYKVEHYIEELDGTYTLKETDNLDGETEVLATAVAKGYIGFTENQTHEDRISEGTIKADGSLILKLYYSRNTDIVYKVEHYTEGLDGVYTLKEIKEYKGTTEAEVTAIEENYEGFNEDTEHQDRVTTGIIAPDGSLVLKLYYSRNEYDLTVIAGDYITAVTGSGKYKYEQEVEITATLENLEGYTYTNFSWETPATVVDKTTIITRVTIPASNVEVIANQERTINEYTISYNLNDGIVEGTNPDKYTVETEDITLINPSKAGYTFIGWTGTGLEEASQTVTIEKGTTENKEYTANWKANILTVNYYSNYATEVFENSLNKVSKDENVLVFTFDVAYDAGERENGLHDYTTQESSLYLAREGYTGTGNWGTNPEGGIIVHQTSSWESTENFANIVGVSILSGDASIDLYPIWVSNEDTKYKVEHYTENLDGTYTLRDYDLLAGKTEEKVTATVKGYTGFTENTEYQDRIATGTIAPDGSLVLKLYYSRNEYDLTVTAGDYITSVTGSGKYKYEQEVEITAEKENLPGYTYTNFRWETLDATIFENASETTTKVTVPAANTEIIASQERTINEYTISYNLNDGTVEGTNPEKYTVETEDITLINPTKQGYTFTGWTGTDLIELTQTVTIPKGTTGDKEYIANWETNKDTAYKVEHYIEELDGTYTLKETENLQGETEIDVIADIYMYPGFTENRTHPDRIEYGTIKPDGSLVLKLYYSRNEYDLTVTAGNYITSVTGSGKYKYEQEVEITAEKENLPGYTYTNFRWETLDATIFENASETTTKVTVPAANTEIIASQERTINEYTISYNLNDGTVEGTNQEKYTVETEDITLINPTKVGYKFIGWTGTDLVELTQTVTIPKGTTGDKEYTANWEEYVATMTIGENTTYYLTVQEAIDAAGINKGATVSLLKDTITESVTITENQNITLNTNGKTLTSNTTTITNYGTLTIEGNGTINSNGSNAVNHLADTLLTIKEVNIISETNSAILNSVSGTISISETTVRGASNGIYNMLNGNIIITESTIEGLVDYGIYFVDGGKLEISGETTSIKGVKRGITTVNGDVEIISGTIEATNGIGVRIQGGTLTLGIDEEVPNVNTSMPTIIGTESAVDNVLSSGIFNFYDGILKSTSTLISGNVSDLPEGYEIKEGTEVIQEETYQIAYLEQLANYTITYNLDGGIINGTNPEVYSERTEDITLINPTKELYVFTGWTGTDLTGLTMTVVIPKGSTGNKEYTANWVNAIASTTIDNVTTNYLTVQEAIDAAGTNEGAIVTLLKDEITESVTIAENQNIVFDLNGKTLINSGKPTLYNHGTVNVIGDGEIQGKGGNLIHTVTNYGTFIKDGTSTISNTNAATNYAVHNESTGTFILNEGTISSADRGMYNESVIIINGGNVESVDYGIYNDSSVTTEENPSIKITGGTLNSQNESGIYNNLNGTVVVTGGNITGKDGIYNISNGKIIVGTNEENPQVSITEPCITATNIGIRVNTGTLDFYDGIIKGATGKSISGTVSSKPLQHIVEKGTETIDETTYETAYLVFGGVASTTIGESTIVYETVQEAINAAGTNEGAKVTLLKNEITESVTIAENQNIVFDLNGKTLKYSTTPTVYNYGTTIITGDGEISGSGGSSIHTITNHGTLIKDGNGILSNTSTSGNYVIHNKSTGTFTLNEGTITSKDRGIYNETATASNGAVIINGGVINTTDYSIYNDSALALETTPSVKINGGEITSKEVVAVYNNKSGRVELGKATIVGQTYGIQNNSTGTVIVNGANIKGVTLWGIYNAASSATITIYDGYIEGEVHGVGSASAAKTTFNIYGGTLKGYVSDGLATGAGVITIGIDDGNVSTTTPHIEGKRYGINKNSTSAKVYFNDGIIISNTSTSLYGGVTGTATGHAVNTVTNEGGGQTSTLTPIYSEYDSQGNFVKAYSTLATAFEGATSGNTIKPQKTLTETVAPTLPSDKTVILDMNNQTITLSGVSLTNNGNLQMTGEGNIINTKSNTIKNNGTLSIEEGITVTGVTTYVSGATGAQSTIDNYGNLTLNGGTIIAKSADAIFNESTGKVIINDGTIEANKAILRNFGTASTEEDPSVKILGGTLTAKTVNGITNKSSGLLYIAGGTITSKQTLEHPTIYNETGKVKITGGTIISETERAVSNYYEEGYIEITGGTITGEYAIQNNGTMVITGGVMEGTSGSGVINNATLTLGNDDGTISIDSPKLIGTPHGINNKSTFNFYDGIIEGDKSSSINGTVNDKPESTEVYKLTVGNKEFAYLVNESVKASYTVEHYIEKTDGTYELKETENLSDTPGKEVTAIVKQYETYTENQEHSDRKVTGTVMPDGSLILKLYYVRNSYELTLVKGDYIESVTGSGSYKFGDIVEITAVAENNEEYTYSNFKWEVSEDVTIEDANEKTTKIIMPAKAIEIIAKQERTAKEYTITYDLADGTVSGTNPEKYTVESDEITLINPTREMYVFKGWTGTDLTDLTTTVTIPKGSTGNREYTANWEEAVAMTTENEINTYHLTVQSAIDEVDQTGKVTLLKDRNINQTDGTAIFGAGKTIELELNNKILTVTEINSFVNHGTLTVNGTGTIRGENIEEGNINYIISNSGGNLTLNSNVLATSSRGVIFSSGNLDIDGATIMCTSDSNYAISNKGNLNLNSGIINSTFSGIYNNGTLELNGGTISTQHFGINNLEASTVEFNSGKIIVSTASASEIIGIYNSSTKDNAIVMNGGEIIAEAKGAGYAVGINSNSSGDINIVNGTIDISAKDHYALGINNIETGDVKIESGSNVTAKSTNNFTRGIVTYRGNVNINGASITAIGGGSTGSYGVFSYADTANTTADISVIGASIIGQVASGSGNAAGIGLSLNSNVENVSNATTLNISGGANIKGISDSGIAFGIHNLSSSGNISINGANISANSNTGREDGINNKGNNELIITGTVSTPTIINETLTSTDKTGHGIYQSGGKLTLTNGYTIENSIGIEYPFVKGSKYGVYVTNGCEFNFYDGLLEGTNELAIYGTVTNKPNSAEIRKETVEDRQKAYLYNPDAINNYGIIYNLDGGIVDGENPTIFTAETEEFTLINPTKQGYTFTGWTGTGLTELTKTVTIPKGSTGSRTYTANWAEAYYYNQTSNNYYVTLNEAINASPNNSTISVIKNANETIAPTVETGKNIVLDLSDKTVMLKGVSLTNNGTLKITGESGTLKSTIQTIDNKTTGILNKEGNCTITGSGQFSTIYNSGKMILTEGLITSDVYGGIYNQNPGQVIVNGGKVETPKVSINTWSNVNTETTFAVLINDGEIKSQTANAITNYSEGGVVCVNGGYIYSSQTEDMPTIYNETGVIKVLAGTIISENDRAVCNYKNEEEPTVQGGEIIITGGELIGKVGVQNIENSILTIGTDDNDISTSSPIIKGKEYGVLNAGNFNYYDGVIQGKTNAISITGGININVPKDYEITYNTETITENGNQANYEVARLNKIKPQACKINYYDGTTLLGNSEYIPETEFVLVKMSDLGGSKEGYTFAGWTTSENSIEIEFEDGACLLFYMDDDIDLYAVWKRDVTFYSGENLENSETKVQYYNSKGGNYSVETPTQLKSIDGWTALGWREDTLAQTNQIVCGDTIESSASRFYGTYERDIIFKSGSGNITTQEVTQYYNSNNVKSEITMLTPTEISGWTTDGWRYDGEPLSKIYSAGQTITPVAQTEYYAVYSRNIQFISGIDSATTKNVGQYFNSKNAKSAVVMQTPMAIDTWTALGWRDDTTIGNKEYDIGSTITPVSITKYYAVYSRDITLKYDPNGGTGTIADQTTQQLYNTNGGLSVPTFTLKANTFTRTNYTFSKWADETTNAVQYAPGDTYNNFVPTVANPTTIRKIYAVWKEEE